VPEHCFDWYLALQAGRQEGILNLNLLGHFNCIYMVTFIVAFNDE